MGLVGDVTDFNLKFGQDLFAAEADVDVLRLVESRLLVQTAVAVGKAVGVQVGLAVEALVR